jgi:type IV pilus assembly protein PilP
MTLTGFLPRKAGGTMKAHPGKRAIVRRFCLVFVLLLTLAAWTSFALAVGQPEPAQQTTEQTAAQPPQPQNSAGKVQQAESAPGAGKIPPEETTALQPAEPAPKVSEQTLQKPAEKSAKSEANMPAPAAGAAPAPATAQLPEIPAQRTETAVVTCPPEYVALMQKTATALMTENFNFYPVKALDPFVPFVTMDASLLRLEEDGESKAVPLTPLQRMTMSEIEKGLKAISWGELGKKAVIEDSTGRGYIVAVGTPAGERNGTITQILDDRLVIKQEIWDRKAKKRYPQDFTIKLSKKTDNTGKSN